ncbi:MAG TPA: ABC transporter ATP-binding protein [Tepidisphaeraceae bacterium]|jgi:ATP-binding cassette subfamily B protein|nr:ABC transporter ATP-binding protein [Tepidisphaeraceae bacterium]
MTIIRAAGKKPGVTEKLPAIPPLIDDEEQRYRPIDRALLRRVLGLLAPYKSQYTLGVSLGLSMTLLDMLSPKFMQWLIDYGVGYQKRALLPQPTENGAVGHVLFLIAMWAICMAVAIVLQRFTILVMTAAGERVQFSLRQRLFRQLQKLSMSYYDKTKLGRIISRCTSDVNSLREVNVWGLHVICSNLLMMLIAAVMLAATTDIRLFFSVAWLGVVLLFANKIYFTKAAGMWQTVREGWTRVSTNMAENITGMRVVTAFDRQVPNLGVFNRLQTNNTNNNVQMSRINGVYQPVLDLIRFVGKTIILVYGGYLIVAGRFPPGKGVGAVVAASLYWDWFMNPITTFGQWYNMLMQAMAGAERVFSLLDLQPDVRDVVGAAPLPRIVGRVQFEHVTFGYDPARPILHDINFQAEPGQTVALVGATGSGKSSIISLIARFYQPQSGRVLVDGVDVRGIIGDSLHKQMGLVLQTNYLFTGTVMENIRYAKLNATDDQVMGAARSIGSHDMILTLKDGYQTDVGERGANMSLGQRQLICFARAFLADPRIFMLDEATSAVDTATELLVQRSLEKLLAGRTTFIVAHRLSTIMKSDCILVIDDGRIIERGGHRELLAHGGKYAHLYEQFVRQE